jgi:hypothetical protein
MSRDEGANGAMLRAFDQALLDATDRRTKRRGGMWWVPLRGRKCGGEDLVLGIKYKILHEEERKERQNSGRTSPLIYIDPPLNTSLSSMLHSPNRKFLH